MTMYCKCVKPEIEEFDKGQFLCMKCELEIERHEDAPEPDEDDFSECRDVVSDDNFNYEQDREVAQVSNEGGRL